MNPSQRKSVRLIGWGLVFSLIDINLGFIDVLPDFIGYIMILVAINRLGRNTEGLLPASWLSTILIFLSLPKLLFITSQNSNAITDASLVLHFYTQATIVLHGLMCFLIVRGLYNIASSFAPLDLLNVLISRLKFYMAMLALQLIYYPFLLNFNEELMVATIFVTIFSLIAEILVIRIPFRISNVGKSSDEVLTNPE